jgi:hypothetical protein
MSAGKSKFITSVRICDPRPRAESTRNVLDVLARNIAKAASGETKPEPILKILFTKPMIV